MTTDRRAETLAIIETINRLFIGTDSADWAQVQRCFAPSVKMDMTSVGAPAREMAPAEITDMWHAGLAPLKAVHHQSGNFLVDVDGPHAVAFCYGIASHYLPNPSGRNTRTFVGSYDFELAKSGGQWVIGAMRFNLKYIDGNPDLESS